MDMRQYLDQHGTDAVKTLAGKAESSYAYLSQIAYGHRRPSPKLAKKLEELTDGEITRHELLPDVFDAPKVAA